MAANEDYTSLVQGLNNLDFSGECVPCKLLLTGDNAFPVMMTPTKDVLIAASKYGKGRMIVMAHESFMDKPQLVPFLKNAINWLLPYYQAKIGVDSTMDTLIQTVCASEHLLQITSVVKDDLGVVCMNGYDDSQAKEIITFVKDGGGLLIAAQAWYWSECHREENFLRHFPGNKITSVAGVYFTNKHGERGNFTVSKQMPQFPIYYDLDFSMDIKRLFNNVPKLDINGKCVASQLLLHGPLTFPLGVTGNNECFFGAAYYGKGRVVVGTHEGFLSRAELSTFILNAISWLSEGRQGKVGIHKDLGALCPLLEKESIPFTKSSLTPGLSVYCCNLYSDQEKENIQQFVAEGGGLFIGGHSWYWSYSNPDVLSKFPGNKILNKMGISVLENTLGGGVYDALDYKSTANTYHFLKAVHQLVKELHSGKELEKPLSLWLWKLRQDISQFLKLPNTPLILSLKSELVDIVQTCDIPKISKECPAMKNSKEVFIMCLAHDVSCFGDELNTNNVGLQDASPVTVQIDATKGSNKWISTGLYLPPKRHAIIEVPSSAVGKGLQVQVGCQSDNLSGAEKLSRAPVVIVRKKVQTERVAVSCIWGGLLYFIVKENSQLGTIPVTVYGAEQAPTFIKKKTDLSSWKETIRHLPAPWAELIGDKLILTVPSDSIRSLDDPESLLSLWDTIMDAVADLACRKITVQERLVADVQISVGFMHSGYPIMCHQDTASCLVSTNSIKKGSWGMIHELGHNQQQGSWEFPPHTTEATCNLWSVYVHETVLGISRDKAHPALNPTQRNERIKRYVKNGANLTDWSVWTALETYLQLQEGFGWDSYKCVFEAYKKMSNVGKNNKEKMIFWAETFSKVVNKNLAPFFKAWGWPIDDTVSKKLSNFPAWEEDPMKMYYAQNKQ
ncbi:TRPM8 channel-associated factor homolog [Pyxicephalus adspersus]|uniref:Peptidase M60 domain-containing protein n=1 Tax=Pyxicephalus adspersus TaxID=30357 RepID=A0AAV3AY51_PYXAD|nr:TPA: hypothetical protein GDO54_007331 [Pyxicephalus adspersus]